MPLGSRLKAAETAILSALETRQGAGGALVDVFLARGNPGPDFKRECVWIEELSFTEGPGPASPQLKRDQYLTVHILVRISRATSDDPALADRAYDVADEVEEALRADANLAQEVLYGGIVSGEKAFYNDKDGRLCVVHLEGRWRARKGP